MVNLTSLPDIPEQSAFSDAVLGWLDDNNLWNLWVPAEFGGLEADLLAGLDTLQALARADGSLGWTVTLCAGANFFVGNLQPTFAAQLFAHGPVRMGGSGGVCGHAVKTDEGYHINGHWRYATGAPYLTHFTLNAQVEEHGQLKKDPTGKPVVTSFVLPAERVEIISDWQTMGMKATATYSFNVDNALATPLQCFHYDKVYLPQDIYRVNFSVFADLTLWVNYIGMAEALLAHTRERQALSQWQRLEEVVRLANRNSRQIARQCITDVQKTLTIESSTVQQRHSDAKMSVAMITQAVTGLYPYLGLTAASTNQAVNRIFRDYFTATQHHIFTA